MKITTDQLFNSHTVSLLFFGVVLFGYSKKAGSCIQNPACYEVSPTGLFSGRNFAPSNKRFDQKKAFGQLVTKTGCLSQKACIRGKHALSLRHKILLVETGKTGLTS